MDAKEPDCTQIVHTHTQSEVKEEKKQWRMNQMNEEGWDTMNENNGKANMLACVEIVINSKYIFGQKHSLNIVLPL